MKATDIDNPEDLRLAAMNYRIGRAAVMVTSPGDRAKVASDLRELDTTVAAVNDVASFQQFIMTDNLITSETQKSNLAGLVDADHAANHFGMLYLTLYAMDSITALLGQALD